MEQMVASTPELQLADETYIAECLHCIGEQTVYRFWQSREHGYVNEHWSIVCPTCGFTDADTTLAIQR